MNLNSITYRASDMIARLYRWAILVVDFAPVRCTVVSIKSLNVVEGKDRKLCFRLMQVRGYSLKNVIGGLNSCVFNLVTEQRVFIAWKLMFMSVVIFSFIHSLDSIAQV